MRAHRGGMADVHHDWRENPKPAVPMVLIVPAKNS